MNKEVNKLLIEQCASWDTSRDNYAALETVKVKNTSVNGYLYKIQYNPKRIQSSAAKVDPKSIKERKCFLCAQNRPDVQKGIDFKSMQGNEYVILVNPFPIFKKHLTIPLTTHQDQRIAGKIGDMLELASLLDDYLIFYNGPKCGASAPDHFHFQAGNKGFLPIEIFADELIEERGKRVAENVYYLADAPAATFICRTPDSDEATRWFNKVYQHFSTLGSPNEEPMLNILAWKKDGSFYLVVYPRKAHRPSQFFAEGDGNILISPASIDLGGVFITPLEKDYLKIGSSDIQNILEQISVDPETLKNWFND